MSNTRKRGSGSSPAEAALTSKTFYDEFSFGEKTPQVSQGFLQWAHSSWSTEPKFVVLASDATIDPRDYEGLGNANFVPTKQGPMNQASLETGRTTGSSISAATGCPRSPSAACRCGRRRSRHAADLRRPGADTG